MCICGLQVQKVCKDPSRSTHNLWSILSPLVLTFTILLMIHLGPILSESSIFSYFPKEIEAIRQLHSNFHPPSLIIKFSISMPVPAHSVIFSTPALPCTQWYSSYPPLFPSPSPLYSSCTLQWVRKSPHPIPSWISKGHSLILGQILHWQNILPLHRARI